MTRPGPLVDFSNRRTGVGASSSEVRRMFAALEGARGDLEVQGSVFTRGAPAALSVAVLSDAALAALHGRFLADPSITDVITFPYPQEAGPGGEICVSADAALRQAGPGRFSEELVLYLVHGWLHLAGHDDLNPAAKRRMRRAERKALAILRAAGAMPRFTLRRKRR